MIRRSSQARAASQERRMPEFGESDKERRLASRSASAVLNRADAAGHFNTPLKDPDFRACLFATRTVRACKPGSP